MSVLIFLVILLVLVIVHEWGHFAAAKHFGIRVDEFGFGFPPRLFGLHFRGTHYTFNLFPIGGFVRIFGENPADVDPSSPEAQVSMISKAKWKQAVVLFGGVFMNFVLAWMLFSSGFMTGLPASVGSELEGHELEDVNLVVLSVQPESPAAEAGLKPGDAIVSVASFTQTLTGEDDILSEINPESLRGFIAAHPNDEIEIGYTRGRDPEVYFVSVTPEPSPVDAKPIIGIAMDTIGTAKLPFFRAIWEGWKLTLNVTKDTAVGLYRLIADAVRGDGSLAAVTGPVGMVEIVGDAYDFGFAYLLSFAAIISVNLAIINLLPFPALDGGRLLFLLIEKIKGSPLNSRAAGLANVIGFTILIILMILVTYNDITRLF